MILIRQLIFFSHPKFSQTLPAFTLGHHVLVSSLIISPPVTSVQIALNGGSAIIKNTEKLSFHVHSLETNFFFPLLNLSLRFRLTRTAS